MKAGPPVPVADNRGWWPLIRESFTGSWQRNITVDHMVVQSYHAVYACATLIASDIAKNRVKLVEQDANNPIIWTEVARSNPQAASFAPVLRKPNPFQTRVQFWESWILSKLFRGATYVLKVRDGRGVVVALFVLDPNRVKPMVADDGSVFYQLQRDNMSGIQEAIMVPAREIIHDRFNCLFHPLIGTTPIFACGIAATQGLNIQKTSIRLFENNAQPGGILTAPGDIGDADVQRLKDLWEQKFSGDNMGRLAVFGSGMDYKSLTMNAQDAQMIEQLKWTAEVVCSCFHVPPYKIGVGPAPLNNNVQSLNTEYYSQCLQGLIEAAEECLDEGLGLGAATGRPLGTEFDIDNLLRMDSLTQIEVSKAGVAAGVFTPNEERAKYGRGPKPGGDSPYLQQQNFSLEALAKRDAQEDPFANTNTPATQPAAQSLAKPAPPAKDFPNARVSGNLARKVRRLVAAANA